ncbi:MAG: tetratricopeptide repeat protein [Alphaproteobacteria bacterium]
MDIAQVYATAVRHFQADQFAEAERCCRQILDVIPDQPDTLHVLGLTARRLGNKALAVDCQSRALVLRPGWAEAEAALAAVLLELGRNEEAVAACDRALATQPGNADAHGNRGAALLRLNRAEEAFESFSRAAELRPDTPGALGNVGAALLFLSRNAEAAAVFRRVVTLAPRSGGAHDGLGQAFLQLGRYDDAVASFRKTVELMPEEAEAHLHLGQALLAIDDNQAASETLQRAVSLKPALAEAQGRLGEALRRLGFNEGAFNRFRRALDLDPNLADAHLGLGKTLLGQGRFAEAVASLRRALDLRPDSPQSHSSLIFAMDLDPSATLAEQQAERRAWHERFGRPLAAGILPHRNDRNPDRRLRIGYVSADFRVHSAANIFRSIFRHHDHEQVEVWCYSNSGKTDDTTREFQSLATRWRDIARMDDVTLAETIRADGIDILVDLSSHTAGHRLLAFARKPAPVQVTAWGYATGTGLPTIDAFFADPVYVAPEDRPLFAETVVDLPCLLTYQPVPYAPPVGPLPALNQGHVTFGCFNRLVKVSDKVMALWARILAAVPGARLVLKDSQLRDSATRRRILNAFAALGIGEERLILLGHSPHAEHLAAYGQVDIGLDPFPQNGGVSSLEAMWMGVPVVTLLGTTPPSRAGGAITVAAGLPEFVAADADAYVDTAVRHATDLAGLAALRSNLRQRLATTPVCDGAPYTRAVEAVYRDLWRAWCASDTG